MNRADGAPMPMCGGCDVCMKGDDGIPRVVRGYVRQDYSDLLNELKKEPVSVLKKADNVVPSKEAVSLVKPYRARLLDNPRMLYAYSSATRVLHDRDCAWVPRIRNKYFNMLAEFDSDMHMCSWCYRRAVIRSGIGDDRYRIDAYVAFFNAIRVSDADLYRLIIENKAQLRLISVRVMQIKVHEDTWRIIRGDNGNELWHNNYVVLEDYSRQFTKKFHRQFLFGKSGRTLFNYILSYSWDDHVEKIAGVECTDAGAGCKE